MGAKKPWVYKLTLQPEHTRPFLEALVAIDPLLVDEDVLEVLQEGDE